jgi:predicted amidophosphoribosyltransferase
MKLKGLYFAGVAEIQEAVTDKLTLNLLTTTIVAPPSNARKWQMGFNSAFKGLKKVQKGEFSAALQKLYDRTKAYIYATGAYFE